MVGYDANSQHQISWFWQGVAGTSSGIITRFLCQPLDVIKIRFQVTFKNISISFKVIIKGWDFLVIWINWKRLYILQLQHEPIKKSSTNYYWNIKQASLRILHEESYKALWKGHVPAQVLSGSYGLAQVINYYCALSNQRSVRELYGTVKYLICWEGFWKEFLKQIFQLNKRKRKTWIHHALI